MFEQFEKELEYCTYCPKMCTFSCPVSTAEQDEMTSPWGKMQSVNLVRKGLIPMSEEVAALSYKCTNCGLCQEYCVHKNDVAKVLNEARKLAVETHVEPRAMQGFLEKFHLYQNPFGKDLRGKLEELVPEKYRNPDAEVLYFASCTAIAQTPELIVDALSLFDKLGIEGVAVYLDPLQCCGYPLITGGVEDEFEEIAELQYEALRRYRYIVSASPTCIYTFRETYKTYHFDLGNRPMTMTQFIAPYLKNTNFVLKKKVAERVIYQDPCYLGRYLKEFDTPRDLIALATSREPLEFAENREKSTCCGQGGCFSVTSPDSSDLIAKRRLDEVRERHIGTLVTHCPSCVNKFRKNSSGLQVMDIISFLNEAIDTR